MLRDHIKILKCPQKLILWEQIKYIFKCKRNLRCGIPINYVVFYKNIMLFPIITAYNYRY